MTDQFDPLGGRAPSTQIPLMGVDALGVPMRECPGAGEILTAHLRGEPRPLCRQHDGDAIRAREVEAERAAAADQLAHGYAVREDVRARQAAAKAEREQAERAAAEEAALAEMDPLVAHLHRLVGAPVVPIGDAPSARSQTPIGDDKAFERMLTDLCGGTRNPNDPEGPTAA